MAEYDPDFDYLGTVQKLGLVMQVLDAVDLEGIVATTEMAHAVGGFIDPTKFVGIWDEPVVVIKPLYDRDGDDREHYAVSSPLFAEFHQVRSAPEPGAFTIEYR